MKKALLTIIVLMGLIFVSKADEYYTSGNEFQVNTITAGSQGSSSATSLNDGGFVVAWRSHTAYPQGLFGNMLDFSADGVYVQRFDSSGDKISGEIHNVKDVVKGQYS